MDGNEFSFHEMEEIKRRLGESVKGTAVTGGMPPMAAVGGGGAGPELELTPQEFFSRSARSDLEALQLRRALRIVRNHWLLIGILTVTLPTIMFLYDAGFNHPWLRDRIPAYLRAEQQYTAAVSLEVRESLPPVGSTIRIDLPVDKRNLRKLIGREEFKAVFRAVIREQAAKLDDKLDERLKELVENRLPELSAPGGEQAAPGLDAQTFERLKALAEKRLPAIRAGALTDDEATVMIQGGDREYLDFIAPCLVPALNRYVMELRQERFQRTLADHQKVIDDNKAKLMEARTRFEQLDALVNPKTEPAAGGRLSGLALLHKLQNEQTEIELGIQQTENEMKLYKRKVDYPALAEKFGLTADADLGRVMVEGNPLRAEWAELETELAKLEARYTADHPQIIRLHNNIDAIRASLKERGEVTGAGVVPAIPRPQELAALKAVEKLNDRLANQRLNLETLRERLQEAEAKARAEEDELRRKHLSADAPGAEILNQRNKALNDLDHLMSKDREAAKRVIDLKMLENFINQDQDYVPVGEPLPARLTRPQAAVDVAVALAIGLILGLGVALLLESMDTYLHTPSDVYYHLKLNYLGVIPFWSKKDQILIAPERPDSHIAEVYAHLCNNIRYGRAGNPEKRLLVASATQGEGKSTISANLAARYALEGNSVVLIDADIRRPRGHKLLDIFQGGRSLQYGLSDYLNGVANFDDVAYETNVPDLSLIPAGSRARNAAKLLGAPAMLRLLEEAEERFDIVIVDCSPVLPVVDATILAPHMRGILMVIAAEEVEIGAVRMALYRLQHVGAPIAGAVLNKVRERSTSYTYYGYRYKGGYYYNPYGETEGDWLNDGKD